MLVTDKANEEGSIPACAGEPRHHWCESWRQTVYPRVCGGAMKCLTYLKGRGGLSPRVRGSRAGESEGVNGCRSIPACAGEPCPTLGTARCRWVYPRVCGGAWVDFGRKVLVPGLSPRVRGSHVDRVQVFAWVGSIPACAGEPNE